jgi:hypothetical protein
MPASYRFPDFLNRIARLAAIFGTTLWLASCQPQAGPAPVATSSSQSGSAAPTSSASDFNALLKQGDYAGAIAFVEKSSISPTEKDGVAGTLILDGLVDPQASTRPAYRLSEGFARMERAAAAGRVQSISDLRAKFSTGINYAGKNILMAPNPALANCWSKVEAGAEKADACIAMRQRLRIP